MHLLLTAATPAEIQPAVDYLSKKGSDHFSFSTEVLITGVTAAATSYWLTKMIDHKRPSVIIQAGIAGCFDAGQDGEVMVITEDAFADCGVWENDEFRTMADLGLVDPATPALSSLKNPYSTLISLTGLKPARAITVNEISTRQKMIDWYKQKLSPVLESMEGAALHYVCLAEKIPFLQLRAISNTIGERDKAKWNVGDAIGNLNKQLISLFDKLSQHNETYFRI